MAQALLSDRLLPTTGIVNFRDYGGYAVAGGGRLRERWLWRSAQHLSASTADLEIVARLGLVAVIDLRGGGERAQAPCPRPEGFAARVYHVAEETGGLLAPHLLAAQAAGAGADARGLMQEGYRTMPFRWRMKGVLTHYFNALAEADGPSLVHCMAGKDRTGLACALLHSAMGVARDDIVADYLLTNAGDDIEARVARGAAEVRRIFGATLADAEVRLIMLTQPDYIEAALDAIAERHGSVPAYLAAQLGIDAAMIERIRERLVV